MNKTKVLLPLKGVSLILVDDLKTEKAITLIGNRRSDFSNYGEETLVDGCRNPKGQAKIAEEEEGIEDYESLGIAVAQGKGLSTRCRRKRRKMK